MARGDSFSQKIISLMRAGYPCVLIKTSEDRSASTEIFRAAKTVHDLAQTKGKAGPKHIYIWSFPGGIEEIGFDGRIMTDPEKAPGKGAPPAILEFIERRMREGEDAIYILQDYDLFLKHTEIMTKLKRTLRACENSVSRILITATRSDLPPLLEREISILDYSLPSEEDLQILTDVMVGCFNNGSKDPIKPSDAEKYAAASALRGLTEMEAKNALAECLVSVGGLNVERLTDAKASSVGQSGILEYYKPDASMSDVGGLDLLKGWLLERELAFTQQARDFGLPEPRGVLLLGTPGCGKSLVAKTIAKMLSVALLRLDVGRVFGGLVGESEANMRKAIATAEAMAPCVCWLDEIEKAFAGTGGGGSTDGGTTHRVFGSFLT